MGQQRLMRPPSESSAELVGKSRVPDPKARINLVLPTPNQLPVILSATYYTLPPWPRSWPGAQVHLLRGDCTCSPFHFLEQEGHVLLTTRKHRKRCSVQSLPSVISFRHWLPVVIICLNSEPPATKHIILSYPRSFGTQLKKKAYIKINNISRLINLKKKKRLLIQNDQSL